MAVGNTLILKPASYAELGNSIFACITALCVSYGFEPQESQIVCGLVRDIYSGLKYLRDLVLRLRVSARRISSQ